MGDQRKSVHSHISRSRCWYELNKSSDARFRFLLKAADADTMLTSELYHTKGSAENGIASLQSNCGSQTRYEKKVATSGKHFFNLKAAHRQVIGTSQMYASAESSR